ncbi:MAG: hypothetical protein COW00_19720 [Bdellovibrio sp. CG12_big_fil_rev_8_21_14_0_65_39_13]|nr:MAG: hypothetical protein COW78_01895 [Bdellovibrio sp. CG22_combo_CG10-13_8_21_14_all_39_27]PIQ57604.1 MAG: hypothetical protein COW00_19720 [Bdellovibrio sp. CG12_big_fil_rev_8_21_14_0_65_39_13]PIR35768.1 MAG: hypothetical protein COV37_06100 [Bdellovibrio sp. CG11_big_fil_rev_8_21_14_0_20_39_38]
MKLPIIDSQDQMASKEALQKYYTGDLIPPEKKEYLTLLRESQGPYLALKGAKGETKYMMDAASQIATLGLGFSPSAFMGTAHYLESWLNNTQGEATKALTDGLETFVKRKTNWNHVEMTFVNSGAEANETALGYCYKRRKHKSANKVLAFEGSFHGRMMVTLAATWNKSKREPFEWPGHEITYIPYPELPDSQIMLSNPQGWRELWRDSTRSDFSIPESYHNDPMLSLEVKSLEKVREALLSKTLFAIIVEPMQCEGGDCYSSNRFQNALLLMAKTFGVPVIFDEVQTGFHLGREFFWHTQFQLKNVDGSPLLPDFVTCAKKAQIGLVLSPNHLYKDAFERQEEYQVASLARGYIHAIALDQAQQKILSLEKHWDKLLQQLVLKHSKHLARPRGMGLCFAFDVLDKTKLNQYVDKRFQHGMLYYPAGDKTLRFRLNTAYNQQDLEFLFAELDHITNELFNNASEKLPTHVETAERSSDNVYAWQELILKSKLSDLQGEILPEAELMKQMSKLFGESSSSELVFIDKNNFEKFREKIVRMQQLNYEPARQTKIEKFEDAALNPSSICLALIKNDEIEAMSFASPLKINPTERGVKRDPYFNDEGVLYMLDVTVNKEGQGHGLGRQIKYATSLMAQSRGLKRIHGRNRDRLAAPMLSINLSLGGHELFYIHEDYPDNEDYRDVFYYTSPLKWNKTKLNLSQAKTSPITERSLDSQYINEQLPYMVNKICLSNFVSARFMEQVTGLFSSITPELRHGYVCSGQSECVDKIAKSLWYVSSKQTYRMLTFKGHYFGNGSFLSRSLSSKQHAFFPVDHLENPNENNWKEVLTEVENHLKKEKYLGIWLEPIQQQTMQRVPREFLKQLKELSTKLGTNLVYNETSSSRYSYSAQDYCLANQADISPDMGMIFLGGQAGIVYAKSEKFISKPLMLISTWDGDEFSFASYLRQVNSIHKDQKAFAQTIEKFEAKLKSMLSPYSLNNWEVFQGKGRFKADLPSHLASLFSHYEDYYLIDPSYDAMRDFIETEGIA